MSDLENLYAVQVLDSTVDQLVYKRSHLEERAALVAARKQVAASRVALADNAHRQAALDTRYSELEGHSKELETRRSRLEAQLRTIVVTREAEALQREIARLTAERETADEEGLGVLDEMELLETQATSLMVEVGGGEAAERAVAEALIVAEAEVDAHMADVRVRRAANVATVPAALVARYDEMRPVFKGVAVARLEGSNCSGCHLNLSRVELEGVWAAAAGSGIAECPQCARLLVK